jgi:hypothetical protein
VMRDQRSDVIEQVFSEYGLGDLMQYIRENQAVLYDRNMGDGFLFSGKAPSDVFGIDLLLPVAVGTVCFLYGLLHDSGDYLHPYWTALEKALDLGNGGRVRTGVADKIFSYLAGAGIVEKSQTPGNTTETKTRLSASPSDPESIASQLLKAMRTMPGPKAADLVEDLVTALGYAKSAEELVAESLAELDGLVSQRRNQQERTPENLEVSPVNRMKVHKLYPQSRLLHQKMKIYRYHFFRGSPCPAWGIDFVHHLDDNYDCIGWDTLLRQLGVIKFLMGGGGDFFNGFLLGFVEAVPGGWRWYGPPRRWNPELAQVPDIVLNSFSQLEQKAGVSQRGDRELNNDQLEAVFPERTQSGSFDLFKLIQLHMLIGDTINGIDMSLAECWVGIDSGSVLLPELRRIASDFTERNPLSDIQVVHGDFQGAIGDWEPSKHDEDMFQYSLGESSDLNEHDCIMIEYLFGLASEPRLDRGSYLQSYLRRENVFQAPSECGEGWQMQKAYFLQINGIED